MYQVYSDSYLLYDDRIESLKINNPKVELELNKTGIFSFTIYPDHPYYSFISKLKSIITVYQDDFLLFCGRVLNDELGFHNEKHIECEGELSYLLDSIQRPYSFTGTISEYLSQLISNHNSQVDASRQFTVGSVTVSGNITVSDSEYTNTWDSVNKYLIEAYGGYLWIRHSGSTTYIDYLTDFLTVNSQEITFGKNLIDLKRASKGEDIATAIIPLGATDETTGERLTIESVNGGSDYISDSSSVALYGLIYRTVVYDSITSASELLTKGQTYLAEHSTMFYNLELSAADLGALEDDISSFHIGSYVNIESEPHFGSTTEQYLIEKLSVDLLNPSDNRITIGALQSGLIDNVKFDQEIIIRNIKGQVENIVVQDVTSIATSLIDQSEDEILFQVSEGYYLKTDGEALGEQVSGLSTSFTQTSRSFTMHFDQLDADMGEMQQYIHFEQGNIILGESTNDMELLIENDKISFMEGVYTVAYIDNGGLTITGGNFLRDVSIGDYTFSTLSGWNLSLKKGTSILMDYNASGGGVAVGKASSRTNALEIGLETFDRFGTRILNGLAFYESGGSTNPNTTQEELILTSTNTPVIGSFYFIRTMFYSSKTGSRTQYAYPYGSTGSTYMRTYGSSWSAWVEQPVIISKGTSGIWTYRKYSDGTTEFFGKIEVSAANVNIALGSWYRGENLYNAYDYSYPLGFTETPVVEMTFQTTNSSAALLWTFSSNSSNALYYLPQCYLIRPVIGSNIYGQINITVKGKSY